MHPANIPWLSVIKMISVQFYKRYAPGLLPFAFADLFEQYNLLKLVHTKNTHGKYPYSKLTSVFVVVF